MPVVRIRRAVLSCVVCGDALWMRCDAASQKMPADANSTGGANAQQWRAAACQKMGDRRREEREAGKWREMKNEAGLSLDLSPVLPFLLSPWLGFNVLNFCWLQYMVDIAR